MMGDDNASHRVHEHIEQVVIGNPHETQYVVIEDVSMFSGAVYIGAYLTWIFQGDKQAEAVRSVRSSALVIKVYPGAETSS